MNEAAFWELIDKTREAATGDPQTQSDLLVEALAQLPAEDILAFEGIYRGLMDRAYNADLWDAAYVINCGCGDDGFASFREWLIGRGKGAFEKALVDPESLADILEPGTDNTFPTMLGVTFEAYKRVTGQEPPPMDREWPELQGAHRQEQAMLERFPKLAAKFWKWWEDFYGLHPLTPN